VYYFRYVVLTHALIAIILGAIARSALVSGFGQFGIPDNELFGLVTTTTAASVAFAGLELTIVLRNNAAMTFTDEVIAEIRRVTWPTRQEAVRAATTVVITAAFVALTISVYDLVWKKLADLILFNHS
jgi:preprotein translocase SecE subunit